MLGLARYRLGMRGLYLCGSGAHPGGGITGGPGQNAAREILADLSSADRSGQAALACAEMPSASIRPGASSRYDQPLVDLCDPVQVAVLEPVSGSS